MHLEVGFQVFRFLRNKKNRRNYLTEKLPDRNLPDREVTWPRRSDS